MAPKKVRSSSGSEVKRQRPMIELKKEIIPKHENGVGVRPCSRIQDVQVNNLDNIEKEESN